MTEENESPELEAPAPAADPDVDLADLVLALSDDVDTLGEACNAYTPASGADWNGQPPTSIREAIDRLARRCGPVPA